ncbi:MAG: glycosyltransferase [bacterium]|nr:glycosyltransferase [Planctomycetota bacterium]HIL52845.1 glycosyltransferase [Planctomycetota bacterium]
MKVLLVANGFPPSGQWGTEYYTHQLAVGLAGRGAEVHVLVPSRDSERPRYDLWRERRYGVEVIEIANMGDPEKSFADSYSNSRIEEIFAAELEEFQPHVVHFTHMLWGLSVGLPRMAGEAGVRTVLTVTDFGLLCHRGQLIDWRLRECSGAVSAAACARCVREPAPWDAPPVEREARRLVVSAAALLGGLGKVVVARDIEARAACISAALESVDHWIFPTRSLARIFRERNLAPEQVTCLPYGLDEARYCLPRTDPGRRGVRFVYMSQYMPHKGLRCLLEAVHLLQSRLPESVEPWQVELHGNGGSDRARLYAHNLIDQGLPRRVKDRGAFEPLRAPEVLARTDCVLVPSEWHENAPLTVLQARAAGVPVIASDVPGVREVLEPGAHGLLFPAGDAHAMADAMGEIILGRFKGVGPTAVMPFAQHLDTIEAIHRGREPSVMRSASLRERDESVATGSV